jgi:4-hydroxybenzoate polyprenyltransferase
VRGGGAKPAVDPGNVAAVDQAPVAGGDEAAQFDVWNYVRITRPDHWIKNVFMLPGVAVALVVAPNVGTSLARSAGLALLSVCLVVSANYAINDLFDARYDCFHPTKRDRPGARHQLDFRFVLAEYLMLAASGLAAAWLVNRPFFLISVWLLVMGVVYNIPPLRLKDKAYLDVLAESVNSPIRFLLGWFLVTGAYLPPSSVLLAYWMGGAFLMSVKRYAEYRSIGDPARAAQYRRSFAHYTEESLLLSSFFYALCATFFIGVFLIKYRVEFVLTFPLFAALFTWYLAIGLRPDSSAQAPEKLYREIMFIGFSALTFIFAMSVLTIDIPALKSLMEPHLIKVWF